MSTCQSFSNDNLPLPKSSQGYLLSRNLCTLFINYINSNRVRAPDAKLLTELIGTFQDGAKHDRRALQSKFKNWARRMDVRSIDGKLIIQQSAKEILPFESCEEVVMEMHHRDYKGHRSIDVIVEEIRSIYTWGRRDFGMDWDIVTSILSKCDDKECFQKLQLRFQPKLLPFKRPRRSTSTDRHISDASKKTKSGCLPNMLPVLNEMSASFNDSSSWKHTTLNKCMSLSSETSWKTHSKLKEGSSGKLTSNVCKPASFTSMQKKKKSAKPASKSEKNAKTAQQKVTFRVEINSEGYNLKSASAFKGDLKNFITSYFKQEAKTYESSKACHMQEVGKVILQTHPLSSTLQLSSTAAATTLKPILPALPLLLPIGPNIPLLTSQSLSSLNSQVSYDAKDSKCLIRNNPNEKLSSVVTYTLPSRPLSFTPHIESLKSCKDISSNSLDVPTTSNSSTDSSFITTIITHVPSTKTTVNLQNRFVPFLRNDSNNPTSDLITTNTLKIKPAKLKLVIEKTQNKNLTQKKIGSFCINIENNDKAAEKFMKPCNKGKQQTNYSLFCQENFMKPDQIDKEKDIASMYDTLISTISFIRRNLFPALVGTGRGKHTESLRSRIDQCMKQVRELRNKLEK